MPSASMTRIRCGKWQGSNEKSGSPKTNRQPLETDWIFWTFRNSGQNSGQESTGQNKSTTKQKKALKTNGFQGFDGGDKRDRTADLLNAIDGRSRVHRGQALQKEKPLKFKDFCVFAILAHFTFLLHARLIFEIDCFLQGCVTAPFLLLCGRMCWASSLTLSWRRWR